MEFNVNRQGGCWSGNSQDSSLFCPLKHDYNEIVLSEGRAQNRMSSKGRPEGQELEAEC